MSARRATVLELERLVENFGDERLHNEHRDVLLRALAELAELRASQGGWEPPSAWRVVETDGTEAGWLAARRGFLTASDVPSVLGLSHYRSRADIVRAKAHPELDGFAGNDYTLAGQCLEDGVCRYAEAKLGRKVARVRGPLGASLLVQHPSIPGLAASPDGVVLGDDGLPLALVEVKVTSGASGKVPAYLAQLRTAMACVGLERGLLAVCTGSRIALTKVQPDVMLGRRLPAVVARFWRDVEKARNGNGTSEA